MNYASDPIWWRLKKTIVRDLASLLTAPSPWVSSDELPVSILLGDEGFRFLLSLDEKPDNLYLFLKKHRVHPPHLKVYAGCLLYYWFLHAPHSRLIARNLPVYTNQKTVEAFNFIVQLNDQIFHLELMCKYYASRTGQIDSFIGLNKADRLIKKMHKNKQQLALSTQPAAEAVLKDLRQEPSQLQYASIIRGMLFTPTASQHFQLPLNPLCWQGRYIENWTELESQKNNRFYVLDHLSFMSPARISRNSIVNFNQIKQIQQGMIALVQQRNDGYWHEVERIMKTSHSGNQT